MFYTDLSLTTIEVFQTPSVCSWGTIKERATASQLTRLFMVAISCDCKGMVSSSSRTRSFYTPTARVCPRLAYLHQRHRLRHFSLTLSLSLCISLPPSFSLAQSIYLLVFASFQWWPSPDNHLGMKREPIPRSKCILVRIMGAALD